MSTKFKVHTQAPTRIDLAGGTLDIWPLYLFLHSPLTVNVGIDLFAEADLEEKTSGTGGIFLRSEDQNVEARFSWEDFYTAQPHPALELHLKLLRHFTPEPRPGSEISLVTKARSPAGAGLGGSSTLSVAIIGAVASWAKGSPIDVQKDGDRFIDIVRDVETTVIKVPAGLQDYYGAMYGGLQALRWRPGRHEHEHLPADILQGLEERTLLFYSGQSRNSGINNWALFKAVIDKDGDVRSKFEKINQATLRLQSALLKKDWNGVLSAVRDEWTVRKTLAPGITTPEIDRAFAVAQDTAPVSGKICGAGGGGCFFLFTESPEDRLRVEKAVAATGVRPLPFRTVGKGLEIRA